MARKSKGFGELLNQQQRAKSQQKSMEMLRERVQEGPLKDTVAGVIENPEGEVKMSEVLEAFVEPYLETARNREQRQKLIAIAVVAWNLALLPEDQRQQEMDKLIEQIFAVQDPLGERDTRAILEELIERKQTVFSDIQRYILDFQLQETRRDFHLSVVSTVTHPPASED